MPAKPNNLSVMRAQMSASGRLVMLRHSVPETFGQTSRRGDHFDLLLEPAAGSKLWTWAIDRNILDPHDASSRCTAQRLSDHRRIYLDFEGLISGERGSVKQVFSGSYCLLEMMRGLNLRVEADPGSPSDFSGVLALTQPDIDSWEFEFRPDQ